METARITTKSKAAKPSPVKKNDRVTFAGTVQRVLGDALLVRVAATKTNLLMKAANFQDSRKPKWNDPVTLTGTVTNVRESPVDNDWRVSIHVDGYNAARVTLPARSVERA